MQCPKLYYYKTILGISTPPSQATLRGTVAHYVFEHIFELENSLRTSDTAVEMIAPVWSMLLNPLGNRETISKDGFEHMLRTKEKRFEDLHPPKASSREKLLREVAEIRELVPEDQEAEFISSVIEAVQGWFFMENPTKFTPTERELYVHATVKNNLVHGFIDRLDYINTTSGEQRIYVSDYKTGKKPQPRYEDEAFFQLAVYAVLLKKLRKINVFQLRLLYVNTANKEGVLTQNVTAKLIAQTEAKIDSIAKGIAAATRTNSWPTRRQALCDWCYFKDVCPEWHPELEGLLPEEIELKLSMGVDLES